MSDFFTPTAPKRTNAAEFSVSELSNSLRRTVEDAYGNVRVRGEISGYRGPHSSGHAYFALKDERARLEAVVWKGTMGKIRFRPEEGMEVIATGKLTTYPGSSKYQIVIDQLEPAGAGALMALLEERKRKLAAEGLFDKERKRPLPFMPRVIGVVTSPTGAVIRDILHRLADRFPLHVMVWPVRVQGETAGPEAAAAVAGFNALPEGFARPDLLIVARGGGSLEDLWGFNDEDLARAVAGSRIPVISAVGHETDWTLIDLAADRRAPTPTGAAEMAVPVRADLEATLASYAARLQSALVRLVDRRRQAVRAAARALPVPDQLLALPRRRLDEASSRLERALSVCVAAKRARLTSARLSPAQLKRRADENRRNVARIGVALDRAQSRVHHDKARLARLAGQRLSLEPLRRRLADARRTEDRLSARILRASETAFASHGDALAMAGEDFARLAVQTVDDRRTRLAQADRLLSSLSYQNVLGRGFAVVRGEDGTPLTSATELEQTRAIEIQFADGRAHATTGWGALPSTRKKTAKPNAPQPEKEQGQLF
ncbi:exodeoxyribonuclease VII large subunit [Mesorhizobium sp. RP14(2022)]|uniref:Exodeoxyribonuclease 7 large subunit n=1 Tax=Mesorhizobium liriopis TaxID=2953882 RepID=A0ABT1C0R4_9HYPH|nr:exodeoxyribonuclease VII large subunit [Mesorhizobium liriopis]MCO6048431.1 exodeoxyribonuclease VII large subunit [Mesorhizobium liriopis]